MRKVIMICLVVGSIIGGYVPTIWGASALGGWSILATTVGGIAGIWVGYKISQSMD